jgi:hypothetical protein
VDEVIEINAEVVRTATGVFLLLNGYRLFSRAGKRTTG